MNRPLLALLLAVASTASAAAPIYRCGPDGRTYSQVPCPEGTVLESSDTRTAAQRAEAKRIVAAERKAAAELESERKAAEKAAAAPAGSLGAAVAAPPAAATPGTKKAKPADKPFTAGVPASSARK